MKQVLQLLKNGTTEVAEVPCPALKPGYLLVRSTRTLVSLGTERTAVQFGRSGWIEKARRHPDKVQMVLQKIRAEGLVPTLEAVFNKLDQRMPLGYCNVGVVMEVGSKVTGYSAGDRIISNGQHAEVVSVPPNLCAKVPAGVSDDMAAFTVIGSIGLQGIRLVQPTLGEAVVVTGLGLVGLMTVQLLRAHGCRVLGIDLDEGKLALARQFGAEVVNVSAGEDPVATAGTFSRGRGVDAVIITAATASNEPVHQAALMCRKRGRIVLVGVTGLQLSRADFYEKELSFQVSCSYGPGRYDPSYEEKGVDYPVGFVRWTEQRNFEAVLDMMSDGRLAVEPLISHRFAIEEAEQAYDVVAGEEPALGIVLQYPTPLQKPDAELRRATVKLARSAHPEGKAAVAVVGAGSYATGILIPAFREAGVRFRMVASASGISGLHAARKFGFEETTTDVDRVFSDPEVDTVVVATRHDSHARFVIRGLENGKRVFVEKPLCLQKSELEEIVTAYEAEEERFLRTRGQAIETPRLPSQEPKPENQDASRIPLPARSLAPLLMVGFNRRFAPQIQKVKALLETVKEPKAFVMTVNAGAIPPNHWTQDIAVGGGRILGEACHFLDLLRFLAGVPVTGFQTASLGRGAGTKLPEDKASITLTFADGSLGTLFYLANGHKSFPKERLEVFTAGRVLQLDNFRRLTGFGWPRFARMNLWSQDKGQRACVAAFVNSLEQGGPAPIPFAELVEVARVTIGVAESLRLAAR